jgi:hypothetical protein
MTVKPQSKMVNAMANQNHSSALRQAPSAIVAVLAAPLLLLCVSGTAQAALQDAPADDSFLSAWTYVTIVGVLALVALIVYKKRQGSGKWVDMTEPVKSPGREETPPLTNTRVAEPRTQVQSISSPRFMVLIESTRKSAS